MTHQFIKYGAMGVYGTVAVFFCVLLPNVYAVGVGVLNIRAHPGQNITLPCRTPSPRLLIALEWCRRDLASPVLFYKDGRLDERHQHRSFVGRVSLLDRPMKDGDVSMVIFNVSFSDAGLYECRVKEKDGRRRRRAVIDTDPITTVNLTVTLPDEPAGTGSDRLKHGLLTIMGSLLSLHFFAFC